MNKFNNGDWVKVYDKDNNLLVAGKIINTKDSEGISNNTQKIIKFKGFSFDNKYFFNEKSNNKTFFVKHNDEYLEKSFEFKNIPEYFSTLLYKDILGDITNADKDILIENDINDLDEEVVQLVRVLNQMDGLNTTGSCCGHNEYVLYVDMIITNIETIAKILWLISKEKYYKKMQLSSSPSLKNNNMHTCMLRLTTTMIGEEAYKIANDFAKDLEIIGRN